MTRCADNGFKMQFYVSKLVIVQAIVQCVVFLALSSLLLEFIDTATSPMLSALIMSVIISAPLGLFPAFIAYRKGRSFLLWHLFAWLFFTLALVGALAIGSNQKDGSGRLL